MRLTTSNIDLHVQIHIHNHIHIHIHTCIYSHIHSSIRMIASRWMVESMYCAKSPLERFWHQHMQLTENIKFSKLYKIHQFLFLQPDYFAPIQLFLGLRSTSWIMFRYDAGHYILKTNFHIPIYIMDHIKVCNRMSYYVTIYSHSNTVHQGSCLGI